MFVRERVDRPVSADPVGGLLQVVLVQGARIVRLVALGLDDRDHLAAPLHDRDVPRRIARALGAPPWLMVRPWRIETPGVEVQTTEQDNERVVRHQTAAGVLTARWTRDPSGTWW